MSTAQQYCPISVLIDELRHDDIQLRIHSLRELSTICVALGPERTRDELIPFLQELVDDEEEVLLVLGEELGKCVEHVGGPEYAHALISPLEDLASVEEAAVREKAIESLRLITLEMPAELVAQHVFELISRLTSSDWFTSRISACGLIAPAAKRVNKETQDALLQLFDRLRKDDTPMVRRAACDSLGAIAEALGPSYIVEMLELLQPLARDEQDAVRLLAVPTLITLAKLVNEEQLAKELMPIVSECAVDKSWRVRYMLADYMKQLADAVPPKSPTFHDLATIFLAFLADQEAEVRTIAATKLPLMCKMNPERAYLERLQPSLESLEKDPSHHVRAALAGSIISLAPIFGGDVTFPLLVDVVLKLLRDDVADVRLRLLTTLSKEISAVVGIDTLAQSVLPSILELARDKQWRVRHAILELTPQLAKQLGAASFTSTLCQVCLKWLTDPVFSVRDAAAANMKKLTEVLGHEWALANVVPELHLQKKSPKYLHRMTALFGTAVMADVLSREDQIATLLPLALELARDPVPNIRFNGARALLAISRSCQRAAHQSLSGGGQATLAPPPEVLSCLERLCTDEDADVRFYGQQALEALTSTPVPGGAAGDAHAGGGGFVQKGAKDLSLGAMLASGPSYSYTMQGQGSR